MSYIKSNLAEIIEHIRLVQKNQTVYEIKLLDIYEGSLQKYLEEAIRAEFKEGSAANESIDRVAPINILPKIISKIAAVYTHGVARESNGNEIDTEMMGFYENNPSLDTTMGTANKYLNLFRYCALEPYVYRGKPSIRVLPPTMFTVWSNHKVNPLMPTVFIKYLGKHKQIATPRTDQFGVNLAAAETEFEEIDIYHMYSEDEFLIVDSNGSVRTDMMTEVGNPEGVNVFGRIPFVYLNSSENFLIPLPNSDMYQMTLLVPRLLTDLNFAVKYASFAINYSIDLAADGLKRNPNSFWNLKSEEGENKSPELGTIKPEVDILNVLQLIKDTLSLWFDSLGMKSSGINNITAGSAESGIAKAIDSADIDDVREVQKPVMKRAELELWDLLKTQHEVWAKSGELDEMKPFSNTFDPSVSYNDPEPLVDVKTVIETAQTKLDAGLTSFKRALRDANPELTAEEIDELRIEIEAEKEVNLLKTQEMFNRNTEEEEE